MDGPSESIESAKCKKNEIHGQYWIKKQGRKKTHSRVIHLGTRKSMALAQGPGFREWFIVLSRPTNVPQEAFFTARSLYAEDTEEKDISSRSRFREWAMFRGCPFPNGWVSFAQVCWKFLPSCAVRQGALRSLSWRLGVDGTQIVQLFAPAWAWKPGGKMTPVCCIVSRRLHLGNLLSKLLILESLFCNCILG